MRKAALPRRPLALLAAAALHALLAVLVVSRAPPPPAEPPVLQVTLVDLPPRAQPRSQPPEPAPDREPLASPDRAPARTEPPLNPRRDATPATDWRVAPSEPAETEGTRATLRARLGCRTADLLALTKAERAACHDALAKGAETAPTYAVVSPKLRKVFEREFECPKGDAWCEYRVARPHTRACSRRGRSRGTRVGTSERGRRGSAHILEFKGRRRPSAGAYAALRKRRCNGVPGALARRDGRSGHKETTMQTAQSRRWDPLVRLTHWGVAAGVLANGVFTEEGSGPHQWVGYGVAALLALRWIWGLVGSPEARFSAFPPSLGRAAAHVREIARGEKTPQRSHNPLGALMVYALWATLAVVIGSGIAMSGVPGASTPPVEVASITQRPPPAADEDDEAHEGREDGAEKGGGGEGDELMEEVHEVAANLLFGLAGLHLLGVAFETRRSGRGVLKAMLPGGRRPRRGA